MVGNLTLTKISFEEINGWEIADFDTAFNAFRRTANYELQTNLNSFRSMHPWAIRDIWRQVFILAQSAQSHPKKFFEDNFAVWKFKGEKGFITGYYEALVEGSEIKDDTFNLPLYAKPTDLCRFTAEQEAEYGLRYGRYIENRPTRYFTRREIDEGALKGRGLELIWLKDLQDAYFIHIQGSASVRLQDGRIKRFSYAAKNGASYTSIGKLLVTRGDISHEDISMQSIRVWMSANESKTRQLLQANESYVFFRNIENMKDELGPVGAGQVQLTSLQSLAIDRSIWNFGTPIFVDTVLNVGKSENKKSFKQLCIAQDTGSAIKGVTRGDLFCGTGYSAGEIAGRLKAESQLVFLLPKSFSP